MSEDALCFIGSTHLASWWLRDGSIRFSRADVPAGLVDRLGALPNGEFLSYRMETATGEPPFTANHPKDHPRVMQLRRITADGGLELVATVEDLRWHVFSADLSVNGKWIITDGLTGQNKAQDRKLLVHSLSGDFVKEIPIANETEVSMLITDPSGSSLMLSLDGATMSMISMPEGVRQQEVKSAPLALSRSGSMIAMLEKAPLLSIDLPSIQIRDLQSQDALVSFNVGDMAASTYISPNVMRFSYDGAQLAWGKRFGEVFVFDLPAINKKLKEFGVGW